MAVVIAAIDAGTNAIRVKIAQPTGPTEFTTLAAERVPVRLGRGTFSRGALDARTIDAAFTAFSRFRKLFDQHGVEQYRAVATSALRNASNREDLMDRCFRNLGLEIEVIDGEEEARLVRKAVESCFPARKVPGLIADLGGGSLEVVVRSPSGWEVCSMRIGTVRMMDSFGLKGALSADETRMIERFVASTIRRSLPDSVLESGANTAVACGGNAEALADLFGDDSSPKGLPVAELVENQHEILELDVKGRMREYGVRKDRAEVMAIASIVFSTLAKELSIENYLVPGVGIREGVLLDLAGATVGDLASVDESPVLAAARSFAARIGHNTTHGDHVRQIAVQLFDQLKELHQLPDRMRMVLELAALLHDVGEVVHRKGHHKHSEYLILQGRIPGLDNQDRLLAASVARAHRKSLPTERKHLTYAGLDEDAQEAVTRLAGILRIADALDTDHHRRVVAVNAEIKTKKVHFRVSVEEGEGEPGNAGEERNAAAFEEIFGLRAAYSYLEVSTKRAKRPGRAE